MQNGAPENKQFLTAAQKGDLTAIQLLLIKHNIPKHTKVEAVKRATTRGHENVFEFLFQQNPEFHNVSSLAGSAAYGGHNKILHFLLKQAKPCKETIMTYAARGKNYDVVHAMLQQGQMETTLKRRDEKAHKSYMDWRKDVINKEFEMNRTQLSENHKTNKVTLKRRNPKP